MGSPKQLIEIEGQAMLARAARTALASCCRPVVVVCGASFPDVAATVAGLPIGIVRNDRWHEGIGTSIHAGVKALAACDTMGAVITLADQPLLDASVYDGLVHAWQSEGVSIVASRYAGSLGVPALFDRTLFPQLRAVSPGEGCKRIIASCPGKLLAVRDCPQAEFDLDTPAELIRLRQATRLSGA
jgi:molybdenum cofactor cytidylyltransferase